MDRLGARTGTNAQVLNRSKSSVLFSEQHLNVLFSVEDLALRHRRVELFHAPARCAVVKDCRGMMTMWKRRAVVSLLATAGVIAGLTNALAQKKEKKKNHKEARGLLGDKLKKNGKHKIDKAGRIEVSADVSNGKVVSLSATDPGKGNLPVRKVKSKKKLAEMAPGVILAQMQLAQYSDYYYGYWFDDGIDEWYYWFTVDVIIVDDTWVEYN